MEAGRYPVHVMLAEACRMVLPSLVKSSEEAFALFSISQHDGEDSVSFLHNKGGAAEPGFNQARQARAAKPRMSRQLLAQVSRTVRCASHVAVALTLSLMCRHALSVLYHTYYSHSVFQHAQGSNGWCAGPTDLFV